METMGIKGLNCAYVMFAVSITSCLSHFVSLFVNCKFVNSRHDIKSWSPAAYIYYSWFLVLYLNDNMLLLLLLFSCRSPGVGRLVLMSVLEPVSCSL